MRIAEAELEHYLAHGYVVVPKFLGAPELAAARENLLRYFPTAEELSATPERYAGALEDPEHLQVEFPFAGDALNDVSTHPDLLDFVERVLGTGEVLLSQAAIWAKYAGTGEFEQGMHLDYQGNSLVVPRDDGDYRQVNAILYYSDVTAEMGPTRVVSRTQTEQTPLWPPFRTRKKDPQIYGLEQAVTVPAGGLLLFGMRTWHRASSMTADFGARFSHHLVYRAAKHHFQGYHHYAHFGERPELQAFVARATPRQRQAIGFPRPGDRYWTAETVRAVSLRYPTMDMTPYRV